MHGSVGYSAVHRVKDMHRSRRRTRVVTHRGHPARCLGFTVREEPDRHGVVTGNDGSGKIARVVARIMGNHGIRIGRITIKNIDMVVSGLQVQHLKGDGNRLTILRDEHSLSIHIRRIVGVQAAIIIKTDALCTTEHRSSLRHILPVYHHTISVLAIVSIVGRHINGSVLRKTRKIKW